MDVEEIFRFDDGSTLFVGTVEGDVELPALASIFVDGELLGIVKLTERRMPGPAKPHLQVVVTRDPIDLLRIKSGTCMLRGTS